MPPLMSHTLIQEYLQRVRIPLCQEYQFLQLKRAASRAYLPNLFRSFRFSDLDTGTFGWLSLSTDKTVRGLRGPSFLFLFFDLRDSRARSRRLLSLNTSVTLGALVSSLNTMIYCVSCELYDECQR